MAKCNRYNSQNKASSAQLSSHYKEVDRTWVAQSIKSEPKKASQIITKSSKK